MALIIRIYWEKRGGHVHCRVFAGYATGDGTIGKAGDLVFRQEEFDDFRRHMAFGWGQLYPQFIEFREENR